MNFQARNPYQGGTTMDVVCAAAKAMMKQPGEKENGCGIAATVYAPVAACLRGVTSEKPTNFHARTN